jgi:hypothetical protein
VGASPRPELVIMVPAPGRRFAVIGVSGAVAVPGAPARPQPVIMAVPAAVAAVGRCWG